mgnify:CR=1 FL=1
MLTYIAILILDYLVVGPWKDPASYGLPKSRPFPESGRLPVLIDGLRAHIGVYFSILIAIISYYVFKKTLFGYKLKVYKPLGDGMRTILGVAVGAAVTPAFFYSIPSLTATLLIIPLFTVLIGLLGVLFFRKFL